MNDRMHEELWRSWQEKLRDQIITEARRVAGNDYVQFASAAPFGIQSLTILQRHAKREIIKEWDVA